VTMFSGPHRRVPGVNDARQDHRFPRLARTLLGTALVAVVGVLPALSLAAPASAHAALTASDPAEGSTVSTELERVELTFSEAPLAGLDAGLRIEVRDAAGTDESTGDVTVGGDTMSKAVELTAGPHTVLWRYVSPDGHPIDGQVTFTVTAAAPASPAATPSAGSSSAAPSSSVAPSASASAAVSSASVVPSGPFPWVLGVVVVLLLAAAAAAFVVRRRRRA